MIGVLVDPCTAALGLGATALRLDPAALRGSRWLGRDATLRNVQGAQHELTEAFPCPCEVPPLRALGLGSDEDRAIGGNPPACKLPQPFLLGSAESPRRLEIEP